MFSFLILAFLFLSLANFTATEYATASMSLNKAGGLSLLFVLFTLVRLVLCYWGLPGCGFPLGEIFKGLGAMGHLWVCGKRSDGMSCFRFIFVRVRILNN